MRLIMESHLKGSRIGRRDGLGRNARLQGSRWVDDVEAALDRGMVKITVPEAKYGKTDHEPERVGLLQSGALT
jgi:hypothetical protein